MHLRPVSAAVAAATNIRLATQIRHLRLQEVEACRTRKRAAYEQEVREQPGAAAAEAGTVAAAAAAGTAAPEPCVRDLMRRLWAIKLEREHKEMLRRPAVGLGTPVSIRPIQSRANVASTAAWASGWVKSAAPTGCCHGVESRQSDPP
jgi:hypothetical protein